MTREDCKTPNIFMGQFLHCSNFFCNKCNDEYKKRLKETKWVERA